MPVFALALLAVTALAQPGGQIAFVSGADQNSQCVCVLDLATGQVTRVGTGQGDGAPRWSPDGAWIAFESHAKEGLCIQVVHADGTQSRALKHKYEWNHEPRWSANGNFLAYASDKKDGLEQVIVVYDLSKDTETEWNGGQSSFLRPVWLPNYKLLKALNPEQDFTWKGVDMDKFISEAFDGGAVVAIGLAGEPGKCTTEPYIITLTQCAPILQLLTMLSKDSLRFSEWAMEPSPDGERIAYESNEGGDREIFVISKRGITNVSNHRAADWNPVWAPDGKWLAFESLRSGRRAVYRVFPDTARVFPVAETANSDCWSATWSPNGAWIAYVSDQTGHPEIFATNVETMESKQITNQPEQVLAPDWRPEPKTGVQK
jgi:Tol biopolymer transport system component